MKNFFLLLFLLLSAAAFPQMTITVKQIDNQSPISGAKVICHQKAIGKTDAQGNITVPSRCKKVEISAPGYYDEQAITERHTEILLTKTDSKLQSIETVILEDKSDPRALEILKKVNDHYKENAPKSLESYSFKSYEKISFDFDEDSIQNYNISMQRKIDSLKILPEHTQNKKQKKDSLEGIRMMKLMGESKLFLWERASQYLYSKKYGEKINILDNRISGLNEPIYEMMAVRSNRNQIPREIREENRSLYRFFLTDTIEIDGRKNYVIRFRQVDYKQPVKRRKFNGYLYIDTETYGLKKIESNSKIKSEGSITSIWKPVNNKWFLTKENLKIRMGKTYLDEKKKSDSADKKRKTFGNYVFMTADYFDFKSPIEEKAKDFKGYTMDVKNSNGALLDQYRTTPLTPREIMTYEKVDSVGTKYKLDQKAKIATGLLRGKLRFGMVDIDAGKIFAYNAYEKFRLGMSVKLNEKFNRYLSPDAYLAYGFGDGKFKYGAGIDIRTSLEKNSFFRLEYFDDVMATGRFPENQWNFRMKLMNSGIDLNNALFYKYKGFRFAYENDITNGITVNISARKTSEESTFDYHYKNLGNQFDLFTTALTVKFSPNSQNIMTPSGKYTYDQKFPELYLNYEQGLKSLGGDLSFSRINALFVHQFKTDIGVTGFRIYGGITTGATPIWQTYTMNGLGNGKEGLNFNLTSYLGFATMEGGKYYNDKFIGTYITHRIPWYFKSFGKNTSSFDLVYRGVTGDMKNPEFHQFEFQKMDHLYNEVGLEWNNFLSTQFNLGFFYRVGYYATDRFKDNFAIQFKIKLLGF